MYYCGKVLKIMWMILVILLFLLRCCATIQLHCITLYLHVLYSILCILILTLVYDISTCADIVLSIELVLDMVDAV